MPSERSATATSPAPAPTGAARRVNIGDTVWYRYKSIYLISDGLTVAPATVLRVNQPSSPTPSLALAVFCIDLGMKLMTNVPFSESPAEATWSFPGDDIPPPAFRDNREASLCGPAAGPAISQQAR